MQHGHDRLNATEPFEGRVRGLGIAVYQWLVMRQGVDTVKPDVHLRRFTEAAVGRPLSDTDVIEVTERAAAVLGIPAYELDWRIWEAQRATPGAPQRSETPPPSADGAPTATERSGLSLRRMFIGVYRRIVARRE